MFVQYNFSPLAFYPGTPIDWIPDYAYGRPFITVMPEGVLLPFQFTLGGTTTMMDFYPFTLSKVEAYNCDSVTHALTKAFDLDLKQFMLKKIGEFWVVSTISGQILDERFTEGLYSLKLTFFHDYGGGVTYELWSGIISMSSHIEDYLRIYYSNSNNIALNNGLVIMGGSFHFECYLDTQVGKPEYEFEEEGEERLGYTFIESITSKKSYSFAFLADEHLCDALRLIKLCDNIIIQDKARSAKFMQEFLPIVFNMEVSWEEQGNLASVVCTFEVDNIVSTVGHFNAELLGQSFNDDYNDDYENAAVGKETITVILDVDRNLIKPDAPPLSDLTVTWGVKDVDGISRGPYTGVLKAGERTELNAHIGAGDRFNTDVRSVSPNYDGTYNYATRYDSITD